MHASRIPDYPKWIKGPSTGIYYTRYNNKYYLLYDDLPRAGLYWGYPDEDGNVFKASWYDRSPMKGIRTYPPTNDLIIRIEIEYGAPLSDSFPMVEDIMARLPDYLMEYLL